MYNKMNKKGFTLMEMLIVVAIIAILIAIAIPVFNSSLAKSRLSADEANLRSAYSDATVQMMTSGSDATVTSAEMQSKTGTEVPVQGASTDKVAVTQKKTVEVEVDVEGNAKYTVSK